ncbi:hypothetical protein PPYR_06202 [Photinus pyralis]|uniref:Nucleoporin Nup133/Nup155-like N-terminal domain-containing protein n=1 Tax=Photinus pyralis TaxID=7054 RepID=A0A5N4ASW4_PHOPY|nr:nuclear pore complex protein Nup154 [Photinus pyralis]XP_031337926.1 nuclear pore complex protein Nup154 [Photinus pyralis]KAB0800462.1 hypothetical protein PPYR_06202 [Photinus pyralis]
MDYTVDNNARITLQSYEIAARNVDKSITSDNSGPTLFEVMNISPQAGPTSSGTSDNDYPNLSRFPPALANVPQLKVFSRVSLPAEILEQMNHMQCHSMMGLFTEINRAWVTVDSDIYIWTYENEGDVAYYDGLNESILSVGLITPKAGVFHNFIKYLLVLATTSDIVVLGVTFHPGPNDELEEIHLVPEPVFSVPTDGSTITTIAGTTLGRIFFGSKDGSVFEISYQAETSWFGKRCKKLNHSTTTLSLLIPPFLNTALSEEDGIAQISIDNTRHILYCLTEKGAIRVYNLGEKGDSFNKVCKVTQASLVHQAVSIVKTLDSQNFHPVVSISAVEATESAFINLVAVSQSGVRFYLSVVGFSNMQPNQRPYTLTLRHIRLPPGYSATMTSRPRMAHHSLYRDNTLMLLSTVNDKDIVWCVSSDMFPFSTMFMEAYTTVPLDGPAWAMAEIQSPVVYPSQACVQAPQTVVRQHAEPPRKYVILTATGVYIFLKLRPVDLLRQLLTDCQGPENDAVKAFFAIEKEDQACATSLILACLESMQNMEVSEWATRAFFLYGGEPKIATVPAFMQTTSSPHQTSFFPNIMSTPIHPHQSPQQPSMTSIRPDPPNNSFRGIAPFVYSSKHNGLYLYLGRILRPIWNLHCVDKLGISQKEQVLLKSTINSEDCVLILSHLNSLWMFLRKNTHLTITANTVINQTNVTSLNLSHQQVNPTSINQTLQDAQLEERQSLASFKNFVAHCCQVFGLWKILCEHQFHLLALTLSPDQQQDLLQTSFKNLVLYGHDICVNFINSLITSYLSDNALIDTISAKLRETCPDLYKDEDAACSKAYELLKIAKTTPSVSEKEDLIISALRLCKSVSPNLNLYEICQLLISLTAYHAIIDLCVDCAKKVDPDNMADFYYKNSNDAVNQDSYNYFLKRMNIYKEIMAVFDHLCAGPASLLPASISTASKEVQSYLLQQDHIDILQQLVQDCLQRPDELLHVAVYEWMMAKKMDSNLIRITQPSLEKYLIKEAERNDNNLPALELLWKYYEGNDNHADAANILYKLASKPGNSLTLKQRVEHLSRGVMCMRSDKIGYAPHLGIMLRDLEDKLLIAKVQEQVLNAIFSLQSGSSTAEEAINALNNHLFDLTELYEEFCDPFNLWECKLSIIDCAGYSDSSVIENVWQHLIDEYKMVPGSGDDKVTVVLNNVLGLIRRYNTSTSTIPLNYIIEKLEALSVRQKADPAIVPRLMSSEVPMETMVQCFNDLVGATGGDRFWSLEENEFYLAQSFAELVDVFLSNKNSYDHSTRSRIKAPCEDTVAKLLSSLYSKPNTDELISILRGIQSRLAKC